MRLLRQWLFLVPLAACPGGPSAPPASTTPTVTPPSALPAGPLATPGESMQYRVSIHGIEVATFTLVVGAPEAVGTRPAIVVQAGVTSSAALSLVSKVNDQFTSWIAVDSGEPLLFRVAELAGKATEQIEARFHARTQGQFPVDVVEGDAAKRTETQVVAAATLWDLPSYLIGLRSWTGQAGEVRHSEVMRSRYLWKSATTLAARETVRTVLGPMPCLRFDGENRRVNRDGSPDTSIDARRYSVWISDDAGRVPVQLIARTDYGDIRMDLVDYQPGA